MSVELYSTKIGKAYCQTTIDAECGEVCTHVVTSDDRFLSCLKSGSRSVLIVTYRYLTEKNK